MTRWIGITLGDVTGIGPEVTLKALAAEAARDDTRYLLIGDEAHVQRLNEKLGTGLPFKPFSSYGDPGRFSITRPTASPLPDNLPAGSPAAANAAVASLRDGAERCLRHELAALVTAPVNKEAIVRAGHKFVGQTEFFSGISQTQRYAMMLLGHDEHERWLRVALVHSHVTPIGPFKNHAGKNHARHRTGRRGLPRSGVAARENRRLRPEPPCRRRRGIRR
jgi:4-hydroxythreonine-4-phosphate dehydrogenase